MATLDPAYAARVGACTAVLPLIQCTLITPQMPRPDCLPAQDLSAGDAALIRQYHAASLLCLPLCMQSPRPRSQGTPRFAPNPAWTVGDPIPASGVLSNICNTDHTCCAAITRTWLHAHVCGSEMLRLGSSSDLAIDLLSFLASTCAAALKSTCLQHKYLFWCCTCVWHLKGRACRAELVMQFVMQCCCGF